LIDTAAPPSDKVHEGQQGNMPDRPLIHDIMPQNLSAKSDAAGQPSPVKEAAATRNYGDRFLEMTPLDFGTGSHNGIATPVDREAKPAAGKPGESKANDPRPEAKPEAKPGSIDSDKPDPFMSNADKFAQLAHDKLGQDLTVGPRGAHLGHVPKKFGCAASVSNVLHDEGVISLKQMSASVDGVEKTAMQDLKGERVRFDQLRKGDLVIGRDERDGSGGRHIGVVDVDEKGTLVAYNNHGGKFKSDPLDVRFGPQRYGESYGIRIFK
jgi:hypothetical protein